MKSRIEMRGLNAERTSTVQYDSIHLIAVLITANSADDYSTDHFSYSTVHMFSLQQQRMTNRTVYGTL